MKKIIALTLMIVTIAVQWQGCTKPEQTGTIYGTVTDFDTGEPVKNANVTLIPSGETTLTGSDGTYMFQDLNIACLYLKRDIKIWSMTILFSLQLGKAYVEMCR